MRLALVQMNSVVGDLDGNRQRILERLDEARSGGADLVLFPELAVTGYPPEDLLLRPGFIRAAEASLHELAARGARRRRARRLPPLRPRPLQRVRRLRGRRGQGRLPQAVPAQLRRLRRVPLLRAGRRPAPAAHRRDDRRPDRVRGRLAARPAGHRPRPRRRRADREHLRVAVPRRQGARARGHADHARARQRLLPRLLQRGRRPGRARLRRPLGRDRRRGRVLARAPGFEEALLFVDVDPGDVVGRRLRDVAAPVARARARRRAGGARRRAGRRRAAGRRPRAAASCRSTTSSSRCGARSSSGCATTSRRTASARSSSASPAGSTRR